MWKTFCTRSEWEKTLEHKRLPDILHRTFSVGSDTGIVKFKFKSSKFLHSAFNKILKFSGCYSIGFAQIKHQSKVMLDSFKPCDYAINLIYISLDSRPPVKK